MTSLNENGYRWIREELIKNSNLHIEFQDDVGDCIIRLPLSDERVKWKHTEGSNPMKLSVFI